MALDLGFVAHAAQAESVEFAVQGIGDGFTDAGLAHTRWAHQQDNGPFDLATQGAHGQKFHNPVLHIIQAAVVGFQDLPGMFQIQVVVAVLAPGYAGEPVQIVARDAIFR